MNGRGRLRRGSTKFVRVGLMACSAAALIAIASLWSRSYSVRDQIDVARVANRAASDELTTMEIGSAAGGAFITIRRGGGQLLRNAVPGDRTFVWQWHSGPLTLTALAPRWHLCGFEWYSWNASLLSGSSIWVRTVVIPFWFLAALISVPPVLHLTGTIRRRWVELRFRRGHCPRCGYNLTANTTGVCPECGTAVPAAAPPAPAQSPPPAASPPAA